MTRILIIITAKKKHSDGTPMNKICRRAPRAAHEGDRITKEIVGRAASGGALAPEPPHATRNQPEPKIKER